MGRDRDGEARRARPGLVGAGLRLLHASGALALLHRLWPRRLTVLAYHRIADPRDPGFKGLAANVSATPEQFGAQLDLLRAWFNVISLDHLQAWLAGSAVLPRYPALITFDDGYRDNFTQALPALRARGLPAALFLATGCVGSAEPFFWDRAAFCFRATRLKGAELPLCGRTIWPDEAARERALAAWLAAAKRRPAGEIDGLVAALQAALDVELPPGTFADQHVTWQQVRALADAGVAIAAHTERHAILSRLPPEQARQEVVRSRRRIEAALGKPARAFAYPNGLAQDYRPEDVAMLRQEGFSAAFVLRDGPTRCATARRDPLEIRRILVTANDDLASFAAAVTGVARAARWAKRRAGGSPPDHPPGAMAPAEAERGHGPPRAQA